MDDLLQSLTLPAAQAREAWQRWRSATVIDALPYACHLLLPALNPRLPAWLAGDPASGIGIEGGDLMNAAAPQLCPKLRRKLHRGCEMRVRKSLRFAPRFFGDVSHCPPCNEIRTC